MRALRATEKEEKGKGSRLDPRIVPVMERPRPRRTARCSSLLTAGLPRGWKRCQLGWPVGFPSLQALHWDAWPVCLCSRPPQLLPGGWLPVPHGAGLCSGPPGLPLCLHHLEASG